MVPVNRQVRDRRLARLDACLSSLKKLSIPLAYDFGGLKKCLYNYQSPLELIERQLKKAPSLYRDFLVPGIWLGKEGEISINPARVFREIIENAPVDMESLGDKSWSVNRAQGNKFTEPSGSWMRRDLIYEAFLPLSSAWDHTGKGFYDGLNKPPKSTGTFLKTGLMIPLLERLRVKHFYCLPFCRPDGSMKKGESASPYATFNPFALDNRLESGWISGLGIVGLEAASLIELLHLYGIRFSFDIVPRTIGRCSAFLLTHPDWFYWVRTDRPFELPPSIPGYGMAAPSPENVAKLYRQPGIKEYIEQFSFSPDRIDRRRWEVLVGDFDRSPVVQENILKRIEREFGLTTAPAFSDWINDPQPPWNDVTYWRYFMDHPPIALSYLGEMFGDPQAVPPYLLPDVIKNSLYPGKRPNYPLWEMICEILPFYNLMLGVDGIRLDMGHALSPELLDRMTGKIREVDPDFGINAENLNPEADKEGEVTKSGARIFTGNFWWASRRRGFIRGSIDRNPENCRQAFSVAAVASHDTSRPAVRHLVPDNIKQDYGGEGFSRMSMVINHFIPGAVPSILSGDEVFERQPINHGLDQDPHFNPLKPNDPRFGKLPMFNHSYINWLHPEAGRMTELLDEVGALREEFIEEMTGSACPLDYRAAEGLVSTAFVLKDRLELLIMAANPNREKHTVTWELEEIKKNLSVSLEGEKEILFCLSGFWETGETLAESPYPVFLEENDRISVQLKPEDVILFTYR